MTPTLQSLLSETPTGREQILGFEFANSRVGDGLDTAMIASEYSAELSSTRRATALAVTKECAKLVCIMCREGLPLVNGLHESKQARSHRCLAHDIHAAIAESEEGRK